MYALCLITVNPGKIDKVTSYLSKKHKPMKEIMTTSNTEEVQSIHITPDLQLLPA